MKILVVDDLQESIDLVSLLLTTYMPEVEIDTALDGVTALEHIQSDRPDLVVLDVKMPGMDGFEVCRRIKDDPETAAIAVLMVSGVMVTSRHRIRGLDEGADGYIFKPFQPPEFIAQVRSLLRVKRQSDLLRERERNLEEELARRTLDLRESEEKFRQMFEQSPDAIFVEDAEGVVLDVNPAACALHGLTREELVGRCVFDLVPLECRPQARADFAKWFMGEMAPHSGFSIRRDGHTIPVEMRCSPLHVHGRPAILLHVRDLTERRRAEERIARLNECFLSFDADPCKNIARLTELIGRLLGADASAYCNLKEGMLCASGRLAEDPLWCVEVLPSVLRCDETLEAVGDEPLWIEDLTQADPRTREAWTRMGLHACLGQRVSWEARAVGSLCVMFCSPTALSEEDRRLVGIVAAAVSVEEGRRCAMRDLAASEVNYRTLIDSLPVAVLLIQDGRIALANRAAAELLRMQGAAELVGQDPLRFMPGDRETMLRRLGENRMAGRGDAPPACETMLRRADGEEFISEQFVTLVTFQGRPAQQIVGIDITERKTAERELLRAEEKYRNLVEQLPAIAYLIDYMEAQPRMMYVSPQVHSLLGYAQDEWQNNFDSWKNHLHPEDRDRIVAESERHRQTGAPLSTEYRMLASDGHAVWFRDQAVYMRDAAAGVTSKHGVMIDITELKRAEAALHHSEDQLRQAQKLEALGRLAGGVAHDFNNMLTSILVYSRMLQKDESLPETVRADLGEILHAGERAAELTRQLLVFSRKQIIKVRPISLNEIISDMDRLLRRTLGEDVELATVLGERLDMIEADPGQIEQVIMNMAINARDAMPHGGTLTLQAEMVHVGESEITRMDLPAGDYVLLKVHDTGEGMTEEVMDHIFEPFYTTKAVGQGTGLGLSTVYGIVQQIGGHIEVESAVGKGSCFRLYFPRALSVPPELETMFEPLAPGGRETVLVVEDEPMVRRLTCRMLGALGYTVLEAGDGREAYDLCVGPKGAAIDLVLSDVVMPRMTGPELAAALKALDKPFKVLFMTGFNRDAISHHGLKEADIEVVAKPFTQFTMAETVRRVLDQP